MSVTLVAPAKINWTLEVLGLRDDGYHEVRTVMQTIDICDEVVLERSAALTLSVEGDHAATDEDHTLLAARLLGKELGRELPASIHIRKRIPVSAGLGGGSSDAAAVLRGLDALYDLDAGMERLGSVAAGIGSDVGFFLHGGTALGEGRGERILPLPDAPEAWLVVLTPPISLAEKTRRMYGALRPGDFTDGSMTQRLADRIRADQGVRASDLYNAFERAAGEAFEGLGAYREAMLRAGAKDVHLAGAGPGMFSLYGSRAEAEAVAGKLGDAGGRTFVARTLETGEEGRWKMEGGERRAGGGSCWWAPSL